MDLRREKMAALSANVIVSIHLFKFLCHFKISTVRTVQCSVPAESKAEKFSSLRVWYSVYRFKAGINYSENYLRIDRFEEIPIVFLSRFCAEILSI